LQATIDKLKSENQELKTKLQDQTWKVKDAEEKQRKAEASAKEKEGARAAAQTELDDLFVVLGDLEEKRTRDKVSGAFALSPYACVLTYCRNDSRSSAKRFPTEKTMRTTRMKTKTKTKTKNRVALCFVERMRSPICAATVSCSVFLGSSPDNVAGVH
jgi:hypothetical protein